MSDECTLPGGISAQDLERARQKCARLVDEAEAEGLPKLALIMAISEIFSDLAVNDYGYLRTSESLHIWGDQIADMGGLSDRPEQPPRLC